MVYLVPHKFHHNFSLRKVFGIFYVGGFFPPPARYILNAVGPVLSNGFVIATTVKEL